MQAVREGQVPPGVRRVVQALRQGHVPGVDREDRLLPLPVRQVPGQVRLWPLHWLPRRVLDRRKDRPDSVHGQADTGANACAAHSVADACAAHSVTDACCANSEPDCCAHACANGSVRQWAPHCGTWMVGSRPWSRVLQRVPVPARHAGLHAQEVWRTGHEWSRVLAHILCVWGHAHKPWQASDAGAAPPCGASRSAAQLWI